jgi:hypothetical protein
MSNALQPRREALGRFEPRLALVLAFCDQALQLRNRVGVGR